MPMPVSTTESLTSPALGHGAQHDVAPRVGVLAALVSRLAITCASRCSSASSRSPSATSSTSACRRSSSSGLAFSTARPMTSESDTSRRSSCDLAAGHARDVEQVVHQPHQVAHLPLDDHALALGGGGRVQAHQVQRGHDGRERVAQLVREHGEELVLGPARPLGGLQDLRQPPPLLLQLRLPARVGQRQGGVDRQIGQHPLLARAEGAAPRAPGSRERAGNPAVDAQRHRHRAPAAPPVPFLAGLDRGRVAGAHHLAGGLRRGAGRVEVISRSAPPGPWPAPGSPFRRRRATRE